MGSSSVAAFVVDCEDVFPGTMFCAKVNDGNTTLRLCGAPNVLLHFKSLGLKDEGCIADSEGEICLCHEDKCN